MWNIWLLLVAVVVEGTRAVGLQVAVVREVY
jgi:hypothetical protein